MTSNTILELPAELLDYIISHVEEIQDLCNLSIVNKKINFFASVHLNQIKILFESFINIQKKYTTNYSKNSDNIKGPASLETVPKQLTCQINQEKGNISKIRMSFATEVHLKKNQFIITPVFDELTSIEFLPKMSSHPSIFRIKITKQTHSIDGHTLPIKKIDIQHTISNPFFSKKIQAAQDKVNRYFSKTLLISSSSLLLT